MGRNGLDFPQESPGSVHNKIEGPLGQIGPIRSFAIRLSVAGSSQRGRVVGGSCEWRVASGGRIVASESEEREPVVREKRQNEANLSVALMIGIL